MASSSGPPNFPMVDLPSEAVFSVEAVVSFLVGHLIQLGRLPAEHAPQIVSQILHRETLGATAIGQGVAIPHCKSQVVHQLQVITGRSLEGFHWLGCVDAQPVHIVVLVVAPAADTLHYLEELARNL